MDKSVSGAGPIRYAVRQVLDQEIKKEKILQNSAIRHGRSGLSSLGLDLNNDNNKENESPAEKAKQAASKEVGVKRDFFGRIITENRPQSAGKASKEQAAKTQVKDEGRVWVSFHEGFSNAVRKPITLKELMDGF
jgi:chromosome transmission fidelity protein 18